METTHLDPTPCPSCGKKLDAATAVSEAARPKDGDLTVCFYCGSILVFGENLSLSVAKIDDGALDNATAQCLALSAEIKRRRADGYFDEHA